MKNYRCRIVSGQWMTQACWRHHQTEDRDTRAPPNWRPWHQSTTKLKTMAPEHHQTEDRGTRAPPNWRPWHQSYIPSKRMVPGTLLASTWWVPMQRPLVEIRIFSRQQTCSPSLCMQGQLRYWYYTYKHLLRLFITWRIVSFDAYINEHVMT